MKRRTRNNKTGAVDLDALRRSTSREAQSILDIAWDYYCKRQQWIPALVLYSKLEKRAVLSALQPLGGTVIYFRFDNGQEVGQLSFIGVLLTKGGEDATELMIKFMEFLRTRFLTNPENKKMTSQEIESSLGLTPAQSLVLNRLIYISPFSGGGGFILKEGDPWWTDLPQDVVNYPRTGDLRAFFERRVMENYNPAVPVEENARTVFLSKSRLRSGMGSLFEEDSSEGKRTDTKYTFSNVGDVWTDIKKDYDINKRAFGIKMNFIDDDFKRNVLFRDIEHAYILADAGFSKPAAILAGSVIEELLRLFLKHKGITPTTNNFDGYIKTCADKGFLKTAIHQLTDSFRYFRNLVHLEKETSQRHTISKSTAKGAVASIFMVVNDLER